MRIANRLLDLMLRPAPLGATGPLELLILQPTPFCNLDCAYCYLPDRLSTKRMAPAIMRATFERVFDSGLVDGGFTVAWHAGEPLVVGIPYYEDALDLLDSMKPVGVEIVHTFQTNATLLTDAWCELIKRRGIKIGVSVDGPAFLHDHYRKTRSGAGTHEKVLHGMSLLKKHGIPFSTISVLTRDSLDHAEAIFEFLREHGGRDVGFNVEEKEGAHATSTLDAEGMRERVTRFFSRLYDLNEAAGRPLNIRELSRTEAAIRNWSPLGGKVTRFHGGQESSPYKIINVDWAGNYSTFSPEMLGDLAFGNVVNDSFESALKHPKLKAAARAIQNGVAACERSCPYFAMCGGGSPVNKLAENGTFESTETMRCRLHVQAVADVVLDKLERRVALASGN